jgi:hypothetical protein
MLQRGIRIAVVSFFIFGAATAGFAADINQPTAGAQYTTSSPIACNGTCPMLTNTTLTLKLVNMAGGPPGTTVDSANVMTDGMGNWSHTFNTSDIGQNWVAGNYEVQLWNGSTPLSEVSITIK